MTNPINSLLKLILPIALVYTAFSFLGPIGGFLAFLVVLLVTAYFNRATIYANRANKKYHNGDFDGALIDLKAAVTANPKAVNIRGSYAYLLLKVGHTEEAAVQINEALKSAQLQMDRNTLRVTKALVLWKQDHLDEAIEQLVDLMKVYETTNVYATLGFLYIDKGDLSKALEFNLEAKNYNNNNAIIMDNLGTTYLLLEDYDEAFEIYQQVMKLKPTFPEAYYNYARVLDKMGDLEKALYMARHSLSLRFWNISTISKDEAETYLMELESKEKSLEITRTENKNIPQNPT